MECSEDEDSVFFPEQTGTRKKGQPKKMAPFTSAEKSLLLEIVGSKKKILEAKASNPVIILKKQTAWEEVETEFCAAPDVTPRSSAQLKRGWENMKARAKTEVLLL